MLQVRENEVSLRNSSGGSDLFAHLRGNIADDAMQIDVHETLYPFYTKKKMPHVTVTISKKTSLAAIARYISRLLRKCTQ